MLLTMEKQWHLHNKYAGKLAPSMRARESCSKEILVNMNDVNLKVAGGG